MRSYLALSLGLAVVACQSSPSREAQPQGAGMQAAGHEEVAGMHAAGAAGMAAGCEQTVEASALGIASSRLNATPPPPLAETVELLGEGLEPTLMSVQIPRVCAGGTTA